MATDVERLIVRLEATQAKFEKQMNAAYRSADKNARSIERRFQRMNATLSAGASRLGGSLTAAFAGAVSLRGAQQLVDAATRIQNALKVAGLSGDELTDVYDKLFASAQKNAAPLETLVQLYSRASLVQKELGVSTEELLGFTDKVALALRVSGQSASESSGALLQLSQALGSGVVRAEEFNSILEGALPIAQAAAAGLEEAGGSVAKLRQLVVDGKVSSEAFFKAFEAGSVILEQKVAGAALTTDQALQQLENALTDAAGRINEVTGASESAASSLQSLAGFIEALSNVFEAAANGPIGTFIGRLSQLNDLIKTILPGVNALGLLNEDNLNSIAGFLGPSRGPSSVPVNRSGMGDRVVNDPIQSRIDAAFGATGGTVSPISLVNFPVTPASTDPSSSGVRSSGRAARKATDAWEGLRNAAKDYSAVQDRITRQSEEFGQAAGGAIHGIVDALADGKIEANELLSIVADLVQQILRASSLGGSGGGFLGGLLSSIFHDGGLVGGAAPRRNVNPAVFAGAPRYHSGGVAGLKPGEVPAILQRGEVVIPRGAKASGGTSIVINAPINAPGADPAQLARVRDELGKLRRDVPKLVDQRSKTAQVRGTRP